MGSFIIGFILGAWLGIVLMALAVVAGRESRREEYEALRRYYENSI